MARVAFVERTHLQHHHEVRGVEIGIPVRRTTNPGAGADITFHQRRRRLRTTRVDPSVDNMLKITGEGRKAALDMRLVDPTTAPLGETKTDLAVARIVKIWQATQSERCTQLVFSDLSTPDPQRFNIYDDVRSKLISAGIPAGEIAFIHDAETDTAKKLLFDAVNAGRVRVLIGSTEKMGAGTNVQRRLVALHHLDAPWRPRDIEQREGRILRQGNANKEVQIYRYVTEGSFDAYIWQTLETKARFKASEAAASLFFRDDSRQNGLLRPPQIESEPSRG